MYHNIKEHKDHFSQHSNASTPGVHPSPSVIPQSNIAEEPLAGNEKNIYSGEITGNLGGQSGVTQTGIWTGHRG